MSTSAGPHPNRIWGACVGQRPVAEQNSQTAVVGHLKTERDWSKMSMIQRLLGFPTKPLGGSADLALLVMRVGLGVMMMYHGVPKLLGGPERWVAVGGAMGNIGITFAPAFWGLCAGLAEAGGGLLLALGLFFRPAATAMIFTMIMAATTNFATGKGLFGASHAIEVGIALTGLWIAGPGWHSLDRVLFGRR